MPIIDTHQHLWDLDKLRLPWLGDVPQILQRSYLTRDYLEATQGLNVVKAVYMEVDVAEAQQDVEADHVISLCRSDQHPTAGAVISGRPENEGFAKYIRRFAATDCVKGVRRVLHVPEAAPGLCLENQFVASIQLLGELGKNFDLCMRPAELNDAVGLATRSPDTQFVLDHCGNADPKSFLPDADQNTDFDFARWQKNIGALATLPNVACKISGIAASAPKGWQPDLLAPIINHCLDEFGPDRVVFGGDWPVCLLGTSYERWVRALKQIVSNRSETDQRKLFHDNAERIYRLT